MRSEERKPHWSVFDGVKSISISPEALMADINTAVSSLEHALATAYLQSAHSVSKDRNSAKSSTSHYDARVADEAYKAGLASIAAGKLDEAAVRVPAG